MVMVNTNSVEKTGWRVIGKSVRGASHERVDLPNQDAIRWHPESRSGLPLILAVSDGHGSAKSFRSHVGAELAVKTAMEVLQDFLKGQPDATKLSAIKHIAEERLPPRLEMKWKEAVDNHITNEQFSDDEREKLQKKEGDAAIQAVKKNKYLAYGATLLTVLVTESFILYLQLGDGDILTVPEKGKPISPLPEDERLFANETTSLCSRNAWRDFRVYFQPLVQSLQPLALILLSSDGYSNSFSNEDAFLRVGPDILEMMRSDGLDKVDNSLETWLNEASQAGSGDDITLGIICRMDALKESDDRKPAEQPPSSEEGVATKEESKEQKGSSSDEETDKPSEAVDEESQDESEKEEKSEDVSVPAKGDMQKTQPEVDRPKISEIVPFTEHREKVTALAFSLDGDILASASLDGTVILWDVVNKCRIRTLEEHGSYEKDYSAFAFSVAFSHRRRLLASTSQDGKVILWAVTRDRLSKVKCIKLKSPTHSVPVREVAFFPDDEILAVVCADHKLILWNVRGTNTLGDVYREDNITAVTVSPDGRMIVCGRRDGKVELLDVDTKETRGYLSGHNYNVTTVSFSPDGKIIASGSFDLTVKLWDVATGNKIANLEGYKNYVNSVAFSPDGKMLASGYGSDDDIGDKGVRVWDVANRCEIEAIEESGNVTAVAFSPDGNILASTSGKLVKLWDLKEIRYHKT